MLAKVNEMVTGCKPVVFLLGTFAMNVCLAEMIEGTPDAYLDYIEARGRSTSTRA